MFIVRSFIANTPKRVTAHQNSFRAPRQLLGALFTHLFMVTSMQAVTVNMFR